MSKDMRDIQNQVKSVQGGVIHLKSQLEKQEVASNIQKDINNKNNEELVEIQKAIQTLAQQFTTGQSEAPKPPLA